MRYDSGANILQSSRTQFELTNHSGRRDMRDMLECAVWFVMVTVSRCADEI
jgi:hypothetical protein